MIFKPPKSGPKVLVFDIETAPIKAFVWGLWDNNVALNQIDRDWHVLSWSAKWLGDPESKVMYQDQSNKKNIENDKVLLKDIWSLLDEADIVITQNGKKFDSKKLNARFVINNFGPPSPYRHIDTLVIAKRNFAFTSNKLEYMTDKLCTKYKKLKTKKFQGFYLWTACLENNQEAWKEMKLYNTHDVLALEELYTILMPWDNSINFSVYNEDVGNVCHCGSTELRNKGYAYTASGKYSRFMCKKCGSYFRNKKNLLNSEKKKSLITPVR